MIENGKEEVIKKAEEWCGKAGLTSNETYV